MKQFISSRWFALFDLGCVLLSCVLWYVVPQLNWLPIIIALFPWFLRFASSCFPFQRTVFDFPLAIFLLTAAVGGWAAYNQGTAWAKFWILVCGVLFFYALAYQPESNLWLVAGFWSVVGIAVAAYFLLTNDWSSQAEKMGILHHIGLKWASIRPALQAPAIHPNSAAGIVAIMAPFSLVVGLRAWGEKKYLLFTVILIGWGVLLAGLLLSASRGAWLAVLGAAGVWLLWLLSKYASRLFLKLPERIFPFVLLISALVSILFVISQANELVSLLGTVPGPSSVFTRLELAHSAINLIADFPFTGGGLSAFPGLYSQYILVVPFYYAEFSHNIFLDVAVEQGVFGLLALSVIFFGSLRLFFSFLSSGTSPNRFLIWAVFASFLVMCFHGLVDNVVYGKLGSPLIFVPAGMLVAAKEIIRKNRFLQQPEENQTEEHLLLLPRPVWERWGTAMLSLMCLILVFTFRKPILSMWYSNLGAVEMARVELAGFPAEKWEDGRSAILLSSAEQMFEKALRYYPRNPTANYRLGIIASMRRNFPMAVNHLEKAQRESIPNRGIQKLLGYNYTWLGQYDKAINSLLYIPEAYQEMSVYSWWWGTQGREDLAARAALMVTRLAYGSEGTPQNE